MGTWRIWSRLIWKEARESWPVLLISLALPLAYFFMCTYWNEQEQFNRLFGLNFSFVFSLIVIILASSLISTWAVDRAQNKGLERPKSRAHLPVPPLTRWLSTFLLPLLVPAVTGVALWIMVGGRFTVDAGFIAAMILFTLANFMLCTMLALVLPAILAALAGLAWLFIIGFYSFQQPAKLFTVSLWAIGGALLGSIIWELCARRQWYLCGRVFAVAALLGMILGPQYYKLLLEDRIPNLIQKPPAVGSALFPFDREMGVDRNISYGLKNSNNSNWYLLSSITKPGQDTNEWCLIRFR